MDALGISSYAIRYQDISGNAGNTLKPSEIDAAQYQAVYVGGGCGHGPDGFANARLEDGSYLVKGKRAAGFPNSTERTK